MFYVKCVFDIFLQCLKQCTETHFSGPQIMNLPLERLVRHFDMPLVTFGLKILKNYHLTIKMSN